MVGILSRKMNPYQTRLIAYLMLGLALALGLPPWFQPDSKLEYITQPAVYLSALVLEPRTAEPFCANGVFALDEADLESFPEIAQAIRASQRMGNHAPQVYFSSDEPIKLAQKLGRSKTVRFCFSLGGAVYSLRARTKESFFQSTLEQLSPTEIQVSMAQPVPRKKLEQYPLIKGYLNGLDQQAAKRRDEAQKVKRLQDALKKSASKPHESSLDNALAELEKTGLKHELQTRRILAYRDQLESKPFYAELRHHAELVDWRPFLASLNLQSGLAWLKTDTYLVRISVRDFSQWITRPIGWLFWTRIVLAGFLLIVGIYYLHRSYGATAGIPINPRGAVLFGDFVFVISMGVLSTGMLDWVLHGWAGLLPLLEEPLRVTFALMYLPCLLVLAWVSSNMGGQSLAVLKSGITLHTPVGKRFADWEAIKGVELHNTYVMVSRLGVPIPRKLQTKLLFKLAGGDELEMYEPGTNACKQRILAELGSHAPARLQKQLQNIKNTW